MSAPLPPSLTEPMTPARAAELQAAYAAKRRAHREFLGLSHEVNSRHDTTSL